ncbi:MAG: efflux RND transporter permease subunit [Firmicutes bacterium]|nr:efflux RND transporter permease subunit [Bacillota bacterium]
MNISKLAVKRPVTFIMLLLAIILIGIVSFSNLSIDLMPQIELPYALVMISYPNASPEEVENLITRPIEQVMATVENLDGLMSISTSGTSIVGVQFAMKTDMNFATLNMREKISMVERLLPSEAGAPLVMKMDMNALPIMAIYVSGDMSLSALTALVEDDISPAIERVNGVASVSLQGGVKEEIAVICRDEALAGYGLTLSQITQMLAADNINLPSGSILDGESKIIVRTLGKFKTVDDIAAYPLILPTREVIQLRDIASVQRRYAERNSISRIDGKQAVGVVITKQSVANTADVSKAARRSLEDLRVNYPNLNFDVGFDQADYINIAVKTVSNAAVIGAILAVLVVFLFLRNISSTLVIAISIPSSLLASFILMNIAGMTLNMFTLCALALAVGMLVDNSVVVLENIYRINQLKDDPIESAIVGSKEVYLAVIASTITSLVVYLPIALSGGMASLILADFCWAIIIALSASLLVALTVVPLLSSRLLRRQTQGDYIRLGSLRYHLRIIPLFSRFIAWLTIKYSKVMASILHRRKTVILVCIAVFAISCALIFQLGMELLPATDEGQFSVSIETPYGTSLSEQDRMATLVEEYLLQLPELKHVTVSVSSGGSSAGLALMGGGGQGNTSSLTVTLVPYAERNRGVTEVARQVEMELPQIVGAKTSINVSSTVGSMLGGADISVMLQGRDFDVLNEISADISSKIRQIDGIVKVEDNMEEGNPELRVTLNRNIAAFYGITSYQLANALSTGLSGATATKITLDGTEIDVKLSLNESYRQDFENMKQIPITTMAGIFVPVGQIASFTRDNSPTRIMRINQLRTITISCNIEGRDLGSVNREVLNLINAYKLPDGYSFDTGGQQEQMVKTFRDLILALLVAILLVFMVLASQFESMRMALIVMMSVPFAFSGSFLALFLAGMHLSITAFTGLIMLVGIVVNNAILLVEFIKQNKNTMDRDAAIVAAGATRMRPILITSVTTIVGMIPLSLSRGGGGEMLAPIGVSMIGGLTGSTLVTLFLIPVLYAYVDDKRQQREERNKQRQEWLSALEKRWEYEDTRKALAKKH